MKNNILVPSIIFCGSLMLLISGCSSSEKKEETKSEAKAIETFSLKKDKLSTSLQLPGELVAFQQVDLYAKVSSFVKTMNADVGTEVSAGQLLITLEAPELSSQLLAAQSRLKSQEAVYDASSANYNRLLETSKTPGTVSQNDIDQAFARKKSDMAQLEAIQAAQKEISIMQSYLEIRAPFNGIITSRNVNLGAYVGPSGKGSEYPLFTLQEQTHLRLVVYIPELYTGYLKSGLELSFKVKSIPNEIFKANIKRKAGALDLRLRSERIELDVFSKDKKLLPGMVAEVFIPLPGQDSTFVVPKTAVINSAEGVFIIKSVNNKAVKVKISKGRESGNNVEVFGTLATGDMLVTNASEEIRDGVSLK